MPSCLPRDNDGPLDVVQLVHLLLHPSHGVVHLLEGQVWVYHDEVDLDGLLGAGVVRLALGVELVTGILDAVVCEHADVVEHGGLHRGGAQDGDLLQDEAAPRVDDDARKDQRAERVHLVRVHAESDLVGAVVGEETGDDHEARRHEVVALVVREGDEHGGAGPGDGVEDAEEPQQELVRGAAREEDGLEHEGVVLQGRAGDLGRLVHRLLDRLRRGVEVDRRDHLLEDRRQLLRGALDGGLELVEAGLVAREGLRPVLFVDFPEHGLPEIHDRLFAVLLGDLGEGLDVPESIPEHHGGHQRAEHEDTDRLEPRLPDGIPLQVDL
mmetsp:Transcript_75902/g.214639  ORF Transcript_75902/g.214639 Transcript_75902/m.214639 type:complete len:325 (+) Transcript_75902:133-1107(+)